MTSNPSPVFSVTVLHCWSAPRSRSTALLYSFDARSSVDTVALDEPLYAAWLRESPQVPRPYRAALQAAIDDETADKDDTEEVKKWREELVPLRQRIRKAALSLWGRTPSNQGVIFCKQMAKFWPLYHPEIDEEEEFFECSSSANGAMVQLRHAHILLIRDPLDVLSSWKELGHVHGGSPAAIMDEMGILQLYQIYATRTNVAVVLDAEELRRDPEGTLRHLCQQVQIPYSDDMYVLA
jgi:protein-lysine N-methyltransferase EEF2KMT